MKHRDLKLTIIIYSLHRDIKYLTSLFSYKEIRIIKKQEVGNN